MRRSLPNLIEKPENPRYKVNCLSYLTLWFTFKIFNKGFKSEYLEEDLSKPLPDHKAKELGDKITRQWVKEVERARKKGVNPSLKRVYWNLFGVEFSLMALILCIMEFGMRIFQPMFVGLLIRYFIQDKSKALVQNDKAVDVRYLTRIFYYWTPHTTHINNSEAYIYATGIILCSFIAISVIHPYMLTIQHIGMKMKIASTSLMYRKSLLLDLTTLEGGTTGLVVNLMSNDVNRFDMVPLYLHYVWISPLQFLVILYFLHKEVQEASFAGCFSIFIILPLQIYLGYKIAFLRRTIAAKTDKRVRQMNEIITGIAVIKMYAWEYAFAKLIGMSRKEEIKALSKTVYIRGAIMSFIMFTTRSAIYFTIMTYLYLGNEITAEKVFFITSCYQIVRQTMSVYLPQALGYLAEAIIAVSRIEKYMHTQETTIRNPSPMNLELVTRIDEMPTNAPIIQIENVNCKYGNNLCLKNINLEVVPGQLTVLIGPVASGKSCLLHLILGELLPYTGTLTRKGIKSYACQDPWLFEGSVRQNILFGQSFDVARYKQVVKACALVRDFQLLPYGDNTIVGERGVSLSGGQRARINLARCVYKEADIYLLDDPLSAVDTQVGKQLFERCISGYLKEKIVILATHQLQYLKRVEQIVVLEQGLIMEKGPFEVLKARGKGYSKLLSQTLAGECDIEGDLQTERIPKRRTSLDSSATTMSSSITFTRSSRMPIVTVEMRTFGAVTNTIYRGYFAAGGKWYCTAVVVLMFLLTQVIASVADFFLAEWVTYEEYHKEKARILEEYLETNLCIYLYGGIMLLLVVFSLSRSLIFFTYCMKASVNLHNQMFKSVSTATMSFFHENASGRILNRFSKDMGAVDEFLPCAMIDNFQITLNLVGVIAVLGMVHYILLFPAFFVTLMFCFIRIYYIRTSRSIKRIEGVTKSPVFSHFNATMQGLTTIRSHNREHLLSDEFDNCQDLNSSAFYLFMCTSRAFGYWLDLLCVLFIALVTYSLLLFLSSDIDGARVGLCITQCIGLTSLFQWGMRQSAEMENQMTSVERVLEFTKIDHEPPLESTSINKPPDNWPSAGKIEFHETKLYYGSSSEPVLKSISFIAQPKEKIGIVGRTGAGKSSLMTCLFRLAVYEGTIFIDNFDISVLGLHDLRSRISIIPQEPLIFSGTMRYNVDPFSEYSDDVLLRTLLEVESIAAKLYGVACLDIVLTDGGGNLSMGQKQLVCIARAILPKNKVLVMDEATANMDPQTDKFIQVTIKTKFADCTVLTIAHRLHTVMHSDRVMVLDAGQIVEMDHPYLLLQKNGTFSKMVNRTGEQMSDNLRALAKENYMEKNRKQ